MSKGPGRDKYDSYTEPVSNSNNGSSSTSNECSNIEFETQLIKPQKDALAKVDIGDLLSVRVPAKISKIELLIPENEVCGNVIVSNLSQLISCIEKGNIFKATVLKLDGEDCKILFYSVK